MVKNTESQTEVSKADVSRVMGAMSKRGLAARKEKRGKNYMITKGGVPLWELGAAARRRKKSKA